MKKYLILSLIIILAAGLRLYKLNNMVSFDFDQEYAANFAYSVINDFPIRMVGQGLSIQGLFMGPWYFYYLTPFYLLAGLHPIGGAIGSLVLGLIIVAAYYWVATDLFNYQAGLVAAFIRAVNFSSIQADWSVVPSYSSELAVIVIFYCFYQYWKGNLKIFPLLALSLGLLTSFHPIQFPLYFVFFLIILIKRKLPSIRSGLASIILFLLPVSPLLIFDYLRKFAMTKQIINLFSHNSSEGVFHLGRLDMFQQVISASIKDILAIDMANSLILISVVLLLIIILKISSVINGRFHLLMLPGVFIIFLFYYLVFPAHVSEYYLGALRALLLLYLAAAIGSLFRQGIPAKLLACLLLFNISFANLAKLIKRWNNPHLYNLAQKEFIVKSIVDRVEGNDFFVSYITLPGWNFGYSYLFKYYNKKPQPDIKDHPVYTIVSPKTLSIDSINISSGLVGLILPKTGANNQ